MSMTFEEFEADMLKDPALRAEQLRTAFAHQVAMWVLRYRTERSWSLEEMAEAMGLTEDEMLDLEAGDEEPKLSTLMTLSDKMGQPFSLDYHPTGGDGPQLRLVAA